ncbi:MAG TPA: ABC transporter ATP-binding protein [Rhizomicrobium sp.]|nr:ABC transporter ATP-binding protein [Rhizomicrobium sp.]
MELVAVRDLGKSYPVAGGAVDALRHLDLSVGQGECVTLLGPSGCGKSTLLRVIAGLVEGYDGEVAVEGRSITGPGAERGMVFQDHRLLPWMTALENVRIALDNVPLSPREKTEQALAHLSLVGLEGFEQAYPGQLSGGMAQRVAIARALVSRPRVLLLDEPFGALDAITRAYMQSELVRIRERENITMIFVTHDVDEAIYLGDRVVVMARRPGRIRSEVPVDIARPRRRTDPAFNTLKEKIIALLEQDR